MKPPPKPLTFRPFVIPTPLVSDSLPPELPRLSETVPAEGPDQSAIRERPVSLDAGIAWIDAQDVLDEMADDELRLATALTGLSHACMLTPPDPSTNAAARIVANHLSDLTTLRDALVQVHALGSEPRLHALFLPDTALSDYLRGVFAWAFAVVSALEELAESVRTRRADLEAFRAHVEDAQNLHFDELVDPIREELRAFLSKEEQVARPLPLADLRAAIENAFETALTLDARLRLSAC